MSILPKRLRSLRAIKQKTQAQVAQALGITGSSLGHYEQGKRDPDSTTLKKIAEYYGVSVDYLVGREVEGEKKHVGLAPDRRAVLESAFRKAGYTEENIKAILDIADRLAP